MHTETGTIPVMGGDRPNTARLPRAEGDSVFAEVLRKPDGGAGTKAKAGERASTAAGREPGARQARVPVGTAGAGYGRADGPEPSGAGAPMTSRYPAFDADAGMADGQGGGEAALAGDAAEQMEAAFIIGAWHDVPPLTGDAGPAGTASQAVKGSVAGLPPGSHGVATQAHAGGPGEAGSPRAGGGHLDTGNEARQPVAAHRAAPMANQARPLPEAVLAPTPEQRSASDAGGVPNPPPKPHPAVTPGAEIRGAGAGAAELAAGRQAAGLPAGRAPPRAEASTGPMPGPHTAGNSTSGQRPDRAAMIAPDSTEGASLTPTAGPALSAPAATRAGPDSASPPRPEAPAPASGSQSSERAGAAPPSAADAPFSILAQVGYPRSGLAPPDPKTAMIEPIGLTDRGEPLVMGAEARAPEPGTSSTARAPGIATPPPPADTARAVAAQIAEVAGQLARGEVEITLSPEELGRVRLALSGSEGAMTISVVAERGETLDLMRRHIEILAQELRDLGYGNLNFSFAQGQQSRPETMPGEPGDDTAPPRPAAATPDPGQTGLDLRL